MKALSSRLFWGLVLVIGGILLLLDTFGIFKGGALFWTIASALAGVLFISVFMTNRQNWWALIPGIIFLTIAVTIGFDAFLPGYSGSNFGGPIILGGIALSFLLVYIAERSNWWAIIPAGVMATIAVVAIVDSNSSSAASGGIFFLGLGITFALVAIVPTTVGQMRWAWIPAAILGLMGILILLTAEKLINYIWPSALILAGVFMMWRSLRRK
jgi:hypothetical protein